MDRKKITGCLFAAIAVVIVMLVVFVVQKSGADSQVKQLNDQIAELKTQLETAAKDAAAELENIKAAGEEAAKTAADELENAKKTAAEELENAKKTAAEELEAFKKTAAEELSAVNAERQAAEEKAAQAAAELESMTRKADEAAAAKIKAESEAGQAKEQLEQIRAAVTAVMNGTVTEKDVPIARILYENSDHTVRAYGKDFTDGVTASVRDVEGEGTYTVGLAFDQPAEGLYFMTLCIENGEVKHPGWVIDVKEVKVNGEPIELSATYTSSDDGLRTRVSLFNEWESKLPDDARGFSGEMEGASAVAVNPEDFAAVSAVEITFDYLSPETVAARQAEAE